MGNNKLNVIGDINVTGTIYADGQTDLALDYIFNEYYTKENNNNYSLMTIQEVMDYTKTLKSLPGILGALSEVLLSGVEMSGINEIGQIDLVSFQYKILEKVEELFIYVFEYEDRIDEFEMENEELRKRLDILEEKVE